MNLFFRLLRLVIFLFLRRRRISPFSLITQNWRVWLNDLDLNLHMTNSRYWAMMDLGRIELMFDSGMLKRVLQERWAPVVASETLSFCLPLNLGQKYQLTTQMIGWDERSFYIEHVFKIDERIVAKGWVNALFYSRAGVVPTQTVLSHIGQPDLVSPPLNDGLQQWIQSERFLRPKKSAKIASQINPS